MSISFKFAFLFMSLISMIAEIRPMYVDAKNPGCDASIHICPVVEDARNVLS